MLNNISITGITPLDCYPNKCSIKNCKQNIKSLKLYVPCQKPDIESINDVKVNFCINDYRIVNTVLGFKFLIDITCNVKVIYTALNEEQSLHSAHWDISFCDFILLENSCFNKSSISNSNLFIGLEDVCITHFEIRSIDLSLLYMICANSIQNNSHVNCNYNNHLSNKHHCMEEKKIFTPILDTNNKTITNTYYCPVDYYDNSYNPDES